jgi:cytochrome P450
MSDVSDPFREARQKDAVLKCPFQGENLPMILRHADVRAAAKNWQTYSSDAPFRVPIPSEEAVRKVRQLPLEVDPPEHADYRAVVEPFFQRPKDPAFIAKVDALINRMLDEALSKDSFEVIHDFAIPLQSRALTYLLNVPESEAEIWIGWGVHVFRVAGGGLSNETGLDKYLREKFEEVAKNPGDDFFSAMTKATFQGRPLTHEERLGYANIAFAGGRDTIIHSISCALGYLAKHPEALAFLREDPALVVHASEEFFRVFMPLTHIGRVCPEETNVHGVTVPANGRVALCWASANFDENAFDKPHEIRLDRKPNPHLSFGFGNHLCLGAPHARLILRTLLRLCAERVESITILSAKERVEHEPAYDRTLGYDSLIVRLTPAARR